MSFCNYKSVIEEGDTVILYMSNTMHAIDVVPEIKNKKDILVENVFQTMFGALKVRTLIGKKYGDKVSKKIISILFILFYMDCHTPRFVHIIIILDITRIKYLIILIKLGLTSTPPALFLNIFFRFIYSPDIPFIIHLP